MTNAKLFSEIATLPAALKSEVVHFVHVLLRDKKKSVVSKKEREFGCAKGLIKISPDFDEPLGDLKDYM